MLLSIGMRCLQHSRVLNPCVPGSAQYLINDFLERRIIIGVRKDFQRSMLVPQALLGLIDIKADTF